MKYNRNSHQDRESLFTVPTGRIPKPGPGIDVGCTRNRSIYSFSSCSLPDIKDRGSPSSTPSLIKSLSKASINNGNAGGTVSADALESIREKLAAGVQEMQRLQKEADLVPGLRQQIDQLRHRLSQCEVPRNGSGITAQTQKLSPQPVSDSLHTKIFFL